MLDAEGQKWEDSVDSLFDEEAEEALESDDEKTNDEDESFEAHPLYKASFEFTVWIDQLLEEVPNSASQAGAVKLSTQAAIASAKLAAALSDDDVDEIGMTIAYLKRALKAITLAIEAAMQLRREVRMDADRFGALNQRLFHIRDGIIQLMGEYRAEWRRRYERE